MRFPEVQLENIIPVRKLLGELPGCTEMELFQLIESGELQAYRHIKTLVSPSDEKVFFCEKGNFEISPTPYGEPTYLWEEWESDVSEGIVFDTKEVEVLLEKRPEYGWEGPVPRKLTPDEEKIIFLEAELHRLKSENEALNLAVEVEKSSFCSNCNSLAAKLKEQKEKSSRKRWKPSLKAVCEVYQVIFQQTDKIWRDDFNALLAQHYQGPASILDEAERIAWEHLPAPFKSGRGEKRLK